jgi:RNA polymerase sigma-70 factor (ECF subfamily)
MPEEGDRRARAAAETAARRSYGKLIAFLAARTGDVAGAEDALSDAFAAALADWPQRGVPQSPEAWLLTAARHRMIDAARRHQRGEIVTAQLKLLAGELEAAATGETPLPDERLGLMFACAHPAIVPDIRAPLILQTILGFDAATIAASFLVSPTAMSQRLVRAKTKIRRAGIPFSVPGRADLRERLASVLEAIYAAFTEGWSDPTGPETRRRDLGEEAVWLGRLVVSLLPDEPEALGLLALMLHADARRAARRTPDGDYVALADQDPAAWDAQAIEEAESLLFRAGAKGAVGRYQLEAAVQSAHVVRRLTGRSDWAAIELLYDALSALTDSPVVAINRAIAAAETRGAAAGLAALEALADDPRLVDYQPYWAARAELLKRTGGTEAADRAYERAIGLESDPAIRRFLQERRQALRRPPAS